MAKAKPKSEYKHKKAPFKGNQSVHADGKPKNSCRRVSVKAKRTAHTVRSIASSATSVVKTRGFASSSGAKLAAPDALPGVEVPFDKDEELTGFRFVDCELLIDFVSSLLCPNCKERLGASRQFSTTETRTSLASKFTFSCKCQNEVSFMTSKKCQKTYEVNRRFPLAIFAVGKHHTAGKKFLGNMNMPPPPHNTSWTNHLKQIRKETETVAADSMHRAAEEIRTVAGNDITVSSDGSWQRRGFQSKNGVVTTLSVNGKSSKVIDSHVLSNYCDACAKHKKKTAAGAEDVEWGVTHERYCDKNHEGSAGKMEPDGTQVIFRRSQEKHNLRYVKFLGDGDCKSYSNLKNADPPIYDNIEIEKLECCGHVQKRMGRQLMNKVQEMKQKTFQHNGKATKGIGGRGGLTPFAIKKIQGHFGAAIRNNVGNVVKMRLDIWAIWYHRHKQHHLCGEWCPSKSGDGDPDKNALHDYVCQAIKPVFETLTQDSLLQKCDHGGTQNTNESFHNIIWQRCPKTVFVGRKRLCLAVADATIVFNGGECGRFPIFERLGMQVGHYCRTIFRELDGKRVEAAEQQAAPAARLERQRRVFDAAKRHDDGDNYYLSGAHE